MTSGDRSTWIPSRITSCCRRRGHQKACVCSSRGPLAPVTPRITSLRWVGAPCAQEIVEYPHDLGQRPWARCAQRESQGGASEVLGEDKGPALPSASGPFKKYS